MAGPDPNSADWGENVARRIFQIVCLGAVLFIGAVIVSIT